MNIARVKVENMTHPVEIAAIPSPKWYAADLVVFVGETSWYIRVSTVPGEAIFTSKQMTPNRRKFLGIFQVKKL